MRCGNNIFEKRDNNTICFCRKEKKRFMLRVITFFKALLFSLTQDGFALVSHAFERKCKFNGEFSRSLFFFNLRLQFLVDLYFVISSLKITTSNLGLLQVCLVYERYISRMSQANSNLQQTSTSNKNKPAKTNN